MKWQKLGKIFDPAEHSLAHGCKEYAQSPQALVLTDRVRVFFSTRQRDETGKYLSHVAYADFSRDMTTLLCVAKHTVLPLGDLGCFDEHGVFPINVVRDGEQVLAYTTGWNRKVSVSADASIGLAISTDHGNTFKRFGSGPVMTASLNEPFLVADAFVKKYDDIFHMWYIYGTRWEKFSESEPPDRVYKIAYAFSRDGLTWIRDGRQIIDDVLGDCECQALPTVIKVDDIYHMYFCFREAYGFRDVPGRGYKLGYAKSRDLKNWARDDCAGSLNVAEKSWDSEMQCYPNIFACDGEVYLLYNGNDFGRGGFGLARLEQ